MTIIEDKRDDPSYRFEKISLALFLLWFILFFAKAAETIWAAWGNADYGHGYLVPLIALIWALRALQQNASVPRPSPGGLWLLIAGALFEMMGEILANNWLSEISLFVSIVGAVAFFLGFSYARLLAAPLGFLLFAIPLPATVAPLLTARLQLLSSDIGVTGLRALDIPVYQEGNVIDLGLHKLQVAEACSGLRYLFPLMSLGYLVAFHAFKTRWKRIVVFLSTIPIAIALNGSRITVTGLAVNLGNVSLIEGGMHEAEGFVVFALCFACLTLVVWVLRRLGMRGEDGFLDDFFFSWGKPLWRKAPRFSAKMLALLLGLFLLSAPGVLWRAHRPSDTVLVLPPLHDFPLRFDAWSGVTGTLSTAELQTLKLTDYLLASYKTADRPLPVTFYVAYYETQQQGSSIHSPQICLPGSGAEIVSQSIVPFFISGYARQPFNVNRLIIQKGGDRQLVYYWFRENGHNAATTLGAKWQLMGNAFRFGRTDGSLIRLTAPVTQEQTMEQADALLLSFMKSALPFLPSYLPSKE